MDSVSARDVLGILEKVHEKYHTTIVIITHNEGIARMADRVIRIHDGKVIQNSSFCFYNTVTMQETTVTISGIVKNDILLLFVLTVNHFLVPVGFILGVPLGYLVAYSMILSAAQSSGRLMSLPVRPATLLGSFVFVPCCVWDCHGSGWAQVKKGGYGRNSEMSKRISKKMSENQTKNFIKPLK